MQTGNIVKFKEALTPDEVDIRFIVIEDRDDRVLVEYICDMRIKPTSVYRKQELELCK